MNRSLSNVVLGVLAGSFVVLSCSGPTETQGAFGQQPVPTPIPFPDSITASKGLPPRYTDSSAVLLGDTLAVGQIVATPNFGAAGATQITARFLVHDTSSGAYHQRTLPLLPCPFVLTLARAGQAPVVWRSDRAVAPLACPALQQSGSGTDVTASWDVKAIMGDSLPSARYDAALDVRTASGRVFHYSKAGIYLDKSTQPPAFDYSLLRLSATSEVTGYGPRVLTTRVVVRNAASTPLEIDYGDCLVNVRLFRSADRSSPAIWKSELRKPPGSSSTYGCILPLYVSVLPPGDSLVFPLSVPMYEVIGDSLPSGHYYLSAELSLQGKLDGSRPGLNTTMPAGDVDIVREVVRLPGSRTIDGLSATATTRVVSGSAGDVLRTLVLISNTSDHRIVTTIASGCPVIMYAYRSVALRDSVPLVEPTGAPSGGCVIDNYPIALDPGQSWVFGTDTPMLAISGRFGKGHYWFTAWLTTGTQFLLAAGDADVN